VVEIRAPFEPAVLPLFEVVWAALTLWPVPAERVELLLPLTRWLRARGEATSAAELMDALAGLQTMVRTAMARLAACDLVLCPTVAGTRAEVGAFTAAGGPADDFAAQARFSPYCAVFNLTGGPAISLPVGSTADGLPVGAMLAAAPGADPLLLATAAAVEGARPWSHRHPAIWYDGPGG
jgi:amidase